MSRARTISIRKTPDTYFALVRRFPLRPIRSDKQLAAARVVLRELMRRGDDDLDQGELDYLEMLAGLMQDYEQKRFPVGNATPLEILKHLMDARNMRPGDLGKLIGASAATMVLKGDRELSKAHIRKLAEFFHVSPAVFI